MNMREDSGAVNDIPPSTMRSAVAAKRHPNFDFPRVT